MFFAWGKWSLSDYGSRQFQVLTLLSKLVYQSFINLTSEWDSFRDVLFSVVDVIGSCWPVRLTELASGHFNLLLFIRSRNSSAPFFSQVFFYFQFQVLFREFENLQIYPEDCNKYCPKKKIRHPGGKASPINCSHGWSLSSGWSSDGYRVHILFLDQIWESEIVQWFTLKSIIIKSICMFWYIDRDSDAILITSEKWRKSLIGIFHRKKE